jgi:hypothetical protein
MQKSDQPQPSAATVLLTRASHLTPDEILTRIHEGWRCVRFEFCISFLLATVRCQSGIYLTECWQQRYVWGMAYVALAILFGPWGVPWGPVWTLRAVWTNLTGGVEATDAVLAALGQNHSTPSEPSAQGS